MYYNERNLKNLKKLADNTKAAALKWYQFCQDNRIEILVYETIRTKEQQRENVRKGASQTMKSYHLVGQALDFVPAQGSSINWNGYGRADIVKAIAYAKQLGFQWGGDWKGFVDKPHLQFNYRGYGTDTFGKTVSLAPKPAPNIRPATSGSVVDYMRSKGMDSSFSNRSKLAAQYGIANYRGTAGQNLQLLGYLQQGAPVKQKRTGSLVDYLKNIGVDSSFANRKRLAEQHGIKNYRGTAEQNLQLLNEL